MHRVLSVSRQCLSISQSIRALSTHSARQERPVHVLQQKNAVLNAFVCISEGSVSSAHGSQPLRNVPIAVKDNICTSFLPTTCASNALRDFQPPFNATVVELLQNAGAHIVGKTNCDEFGMGSMNIHSIHGPVINPYRPPDADSSGETILERRSAGGSSGGSAAAVSADLCYGALATDTGGSVRLPASYCGVAGFKPSYGLISRWGVVSFADSLDCVSIVAKRVDAVQEIFGTVSIYDPKDPTAVPVEIRNRALQVSAPASGQSSVAKKQLAHLRIGIPQEYFPSELQTAILIPFKKVVSQLKALGAVVVPVSLPSTTFALSAYYVIASAEASSNLARFDGIQYGSRLNYPEDLDRSKPADVFAYSRSAGFGTEVKKRILLGTYALTAEAFDNYFLQAQRVRNLVKADFNRVFRVPNVLTDVQSELLPESSDGVDVILHPSAIRTAPSLPSFPKKESISDLGTDTSSVSGIDTYLQDVLTVPASLAGLPALSVPAGRGTDGWPVGVSIVGQWGCDEAVLSVGNAIEELVGSDEPR